MRPRALLQNQQTMESNCTETIDVALNRHTTETRVAYESPTSRMPGGVIVGDWYLVCACCCVPVQLLPIVC